MRFYQREARGATLKGIITCGARVGYEDGREFDLEETISVLNEINRERSESGAMTLPCIIKEGTLIGRSADSDYREQIYQLEFSWSPRYKEIPRDTFREALLAYADELGQRMEQQRMYVEFDGETTVLKRS
ncbi:hypothetical protein HYT55_00225 [Candidatus Woesearchaeota archaeon]|nr:hypothetical protein [Candidatus Woesearchaeota archaeon]